MSELSKMTCVACKGTDPALTPNEIEQYRTGLPEWELIYEAGPADPCGASFASKNFAGGSGFYQPGWRDR